MGKRRMKLMIAYDGSAYADAAVNDLARAGFPHDLDVLVVSVADLTSRRPAVSEFNLISAASRRVDMVVDQIRHYEAQILKEARTMTSKVVHSLRKRFPGWSVHAEILQGTPADDLLKKASQWKADVLMCGSAGRSAIGRFFLGSVSRSVGEKANVSVRVARSGFGNVGTAPIKTILGVGNPTEAEKVIRSFSDRVWPAGSQVRLIAVDDGSSPGRVSPFYPDGKLIYESAAEAVKAAGLDVSVQIESGDPSTLLLEAADAWQADAIFITAAGPGRDGLSSTAAALITDAKCTIEVVR